MAWRPTSFFRSHSNVVFSNAFGGSRVVHLQAPLLLGNDIPKMDAVALGVVTNKDAIAVSQDALGVQARRVSTGNSNSNTNGGSGVLRAGASVLAVAARCDTSRPTQVWTHEGVSGTLSTIDATGSRWCVQDAENTEEVGSWRGVPCSAAAAGTALRQQPLQGSGAKVALVTPGQAHLTVNNALGASGPVAHTRYLSADKECSPGSSWTRRRAVGAGLRAPGAPAFRLVAGDRAGLRSDDKVGGVAAGGDFCLDLVQDSDSEVSARAEVAQLDFAKLKEKGGVSPCWCTAAAVEALRTATKLTATKLTIVLFVRHFFVGLGGAARRKEVGGGAPQPRRAAQRHDYRRLYHV